MTFSVLARSTAFEFAMLELVHYPAHDSALAGRLAAHRVPLFADVPTDRLSLVRS